MVKASCWPWIPAWSSTESGPKLHDAKDAVEHLQRYRAVEYVLLTIISSFSLHFSAAEDSRSQSNQRMAQTALTQMLSAIAPKFARCKMRLTKLTEHSISIFWIIFRGNCSHFASGHYSADGVEFSWHAALTWISCKVSMFSNCSECFLFLCGSGPAELMKLGMLALGSDSSFEKRRSFEPSFDMSPYLVSIENVQFVLFVWWEQSCRQSGKKNRRSQETFDWILTAQFQTESA